MAMGSSEATGGRTKPMSFPCGVHAPGRELFQLCVTLENRPGALAEVAAVLAENNVNILSGHIEALPGQGHGLFSAFIDITEVSTNLASLLEELEGLSSVLEVKLLEPVMPGVVVNRALFPLKFMGEHAVIVDVRQVGHMFGRLGEVFSTGASVIIYEMGLRAGNALLASIRENFGVEGLDALKLMAALGMARGWCRTEVVEWDEEKPRLVVRMWDLFECMPFRNQGGRPRSHFMRGLLAGVVKAMTGVEVMARETRCIAKGDPYCEFVVEAP